MLVSRSHRFMFLAGTKSASTTVEFALRRHCQVALLRPEHGKHISYPEAIRLIGPLLGRARTQPADLFRFGVIRDPIDWVVSWYNYRSRESLQAAGESGNSCAGVEFSQFAEAVMQHAARPGYAKLGTQSKRFHGTDGAVAVDYLIPLPRLQADLIIIAEALAIKGTIDIGQKSLNVSPAIFSASDIPAVLAARLRAHLVRDVALYERALQATAEELLRLLGEKTVRMTRPRSPSA